MSEVMIGVGVAFIVIFPTFLIAKVVYPIMDRIFSFLLRPFQKKKDGDDECVSIVIL